MGLLNRWFGFRWSLYIVRDGTLAFAMHGNSVIRIVGYVLPFFAGAKSPIAPWELYLNFNPKHQTIKLIPAHFSRDGENVTRLLLEQIEAIDKGWKVKGGEPVFIEAATKKKLKISDASMIRSGADVQALIDKIDEPRKPTFFSVMRTVFGVTSSPRS